MLIIKEAIKFHRSETPIAEQEEFDQRLKQPYDGYMGMLPPRMTAEKKRIFNGKGDSLS